MHHSRRQTDNPGVDVASLLRHVHVEHAVRGHTKERAIVPARPQRTLCAQSRAAQVPFEHIAGGAIETEYFSAMWFHSCT
jgi:hypothetical protein